jgi:hypothetical protein
MIKVSDTVLEIINDDEIAYEAFRQNLLSFNAYAKKIKPIVEEKTFKEVKIGTIVVALSRLKKHTSSFDQLKPQVKVQSINLKSPLVETTYERIAETRKKVSDLKNELLQEDNFFAITEGVNEITLIYPQAYEKLVRKHFNDNPKGEYKNLGAVTIKFNEHEYIEVPNMIYTLVSALATKRINLIEIVSTFSEISFIVRINEVNKTIEALNQFLT